jgi:NhaP-type Na+/H+ or K+/H+ antiporter
LNEDLLNGLTLVMVLGIGSQWIAWRVKLPSILVLLLVGTVAGPITGILNTDELLGDLLFPLVSLSVAVILFEGGLSLKWADVRETRHVVRNLITIGALVTWITSSTAAYFIFDIELATAFLLGAILVVTGPTVVTPLLNQIRPAARVGSVLRWEGIVIDPIGAVLAVLVFEQIMAGDKHPGFYQFGIELVFTLFIGLAIGILVGRMLIEVFSRYWVPETLQSPIALMAVLGAYSLSNHFQPESGLLTVTVMGIVMTNQKRFDLRHIIEFKEITQILLISSLFILLAARIKLEDFQDFGGTILLFIAVMIFFVRPLSVWLSTMGSPLTWREKVLIAWMAPRGIVAAAVASIFSLELLNHGHEDAAIIVPVTFATIIGTVTIYGLTAGLLARWLGLIRKNPQGLMIVGAHDWVCQIALQVQTAGFRVVLVDTNYSNVSHASGLGLEAVNSNVVTTFKDGDLDFNGIGRLLAMTPNDDVNALANIRFKDSLVNVFQLPRRDSVGNSESSQVDSNYLFGETITFEYLTIHFNKGAEVRAIRIQDADEFLTQCMDRVIPFLIINEEGELIIWTVNNPPVIRDGNTVIAMVDPADEDVRSTQEFLVMDALRGIVPVAVEDMHLPTSK